MNAEWSTLVSCNVGTFPIIGSVCGRELLAARLYVPRSKVLAARWFLVTGTHTSLLCICWSQPGPVNGWDSGEQASCKKTIATVVHRARYLLVAIELEYTAYGLDTLRILPLP